MGLPPVPRACRWRPCATLCLGILSRHPIPPRNVVGHSDVAPDRKDDPGELFDWRGLAANGVGLWPGPDGDPVADTTATLAAIGYRTDLPTEVVLRAFQRHWRQDRVDGIADEDTRRRLAAVLDCVVRSEKRS